MVKRILTLAALTLLAGCGVDLTEAVEISYVMSLEVGNLWELSVNGYEVSSGDTTFLAGTLTKTIISEVTHSEGFQIFKVEEVTVLADADTVTSFTGEYYLRNAFDELRVYSDTTSTEFFVLFKHNPIAGDVWTPGSDLNQQIEVMGIYNTIDVPADIFYHCACTKETSSSDPAFMKRNYWGNHSEGIICSVEQDSDFYFIYELTGISLQ